MVTQSRGPSGPACGRSPGRCASSAARRCDSSLATAHRSANSSSMSWQGERSGSGQAPRDTPRAAHRPALHERLLAEPGLLPGVPEHGPLPLLRRRSADKPLIFIVLNAFLVVCGRNGCIDRKGQRVASARRNFPSISIFQIYRFGRTRRQNQQSQHDSPCHFRPFRLSHEARCSDATALVLTRSLRCVSHRCALSVSMRCIFPVRVMPHPSAARGRGHRRH
jgi:hypothetical protein